MLVQFTKGAPTGPADLVTCVRDDGTRSDAEMPRQGVLPAAAMHYVVETTLGWRAGWFGLVARGASFESLAPGRSENRGAATSQAQQASALVEALQAEQWGGATDPRAFEQKLTAACRRSGVPPPGLSTADLARLRGALREFGARWRPLPAGGVLERTF